ncbi:cysteine sulfinic acid decarboxylase [Agrilus planipennis]|uniref:Cysteine sulfinic acid decarboxylase n=1 Tax=Agrilus planipennis TaxID=224129 RepID=A0A1W4WSF2_AGRPL|nr:cysteine sulfinic acid decarboxylase [Agrilus planipennis]
MPINNGVLMNGVSEEKQIVTKIKTDDLPESSPVKNHLNGTTNGYSKNLSNGNGTSSNDNCSYETIPVKSTHEKFFCDALNILLNDAVFQGTSRKNKILEWKSPAELTKAFDFALEEKSSTHENLLKLLQDTIQYSVKTGHPYFVNQLFSSLDPYGLIGQWLTDSLNASVYTFEVAPVFTLMEEFVLKEMIKFVGFDPDTSDGIFCPGGSMANGYAISCARYKKFPNIKEKGLHSLPRTVLFTSEDAHYSVKKMASFLGIGGDNVYLIHTDNRGKMSIPHLEEQIERAKEEGAVPFMISATAGTTVLGAFDPLEEVADVCEKYGLWLHVDAAWGGGALLSKRHKYLLNGIHRADSVTWNPHKLLAAPQQCSTFLLRHKNILSDAHSANASYLFQKDKFYDTRFDTGDKHVQCGRRADVFKFWFMWKAKGTSGLENHVDKVFDNARFFATSLDHRSNFEMVLNSPEFTNICFWYIPPSLRNRKSDKDYKEKLNKVAPKIKERMVQEGCMMVTYQPLRDLPNFFRIVFQSSGLELSDMTHLLNEFERLGSDL